MQGDFSRDSFDPQRAFSRVLSQQGRLMLDADWNEMQSIQLHFLRALAADLIGPFGGSGFAIDSVTPEDFKIAAGRYYVDGWLCENDGAVWYAGNKGPAQPWWPVPKKPGLERGPHLVYLDVWERHLSWAEADGPVEIERRSPPWLREVALGGPDTASRAQVVWQIKVARSFTDADDEHPVPDRTTDREWRDWVMKNWESWKAHWQPQARGLLTVITEPAGSASQAPCAVSPQARYRGVENQLYRVEVHREGTAGIGGATFKWSRENASVVLPVHSIAGSTVRLSAWWRDDRLGLTEGDWVEVVDDEVSLAQKAHPMHRVKRVDRDAMEVRLDATPKVTADDASRHPILRRWDHRADKSATPDGIAIAEDNNVSFVLEDGIRVRFSPAAGKLPHRYRTGDHWLIAARAPIADVIWPRDASGAAMALAPKGITHRYAPLAVIDIGGKENPVSLRREIKTVSG